MNPPNSAESESLKVPEQPTLPKTPETKPFVPGPAEQSIIKKIQMGGDPDMTLQAIAQSQIEQPTSGTPAVGMERFGEDAKAYDEKEKSKIYEDPEQDPQIQATIKD